MFFVYQMKYLLQQRCRTTQSCRHKALLSSSGLDSIEKDSWSARQMLPRIWDQIWGGSLSFSIILGWSFSHRCRRIDTLHNSGLWCFCSKVYANYTSRLRKIFVHEYKCKFYIYLFIFFIFFMYSSFGSFMWLMISLNPECNIISTTSWNKEECLAFQSNQMYYYVETKDRC